jgi:eukaryotic-like serine/threonine-protein kinase
VTTDIRTQLQATLGNAYILERELGGGGMSRVFVANETALNRKVVVKVLPPDLAASVSVDRFKREIQVAAALQHPHIVPVLASGEVEGLPFYTMPFVDGESLRARLAGGPLPIPETTAILRDVAKALAFAHDRGVIHRDVKPDNVLLTGGSATVTDFGIAKALSASRLEGVAAATLTQLGTSLGTPAYMAPEQAAGDPSADHRADIYSFGAMAYELLTGRPPFHGLSPQKLLAAQMSERPVPVTDLRPDTPPVLADLVMRCLEKEAQARPQRAAEVLTALDSTTSAGSQAAMPAVLLGGRGALRKALSIYAAAFIVVAVLTRAAIVGIGLPDWVFPGALIVMALGLPIILFTGYVHRATQRALTATPTLTPGGSAVPASTMATIAIKAAPMVSWRRTAMGGVYAVGGFVVLVGVWMLMRTLGIGPAASLMSAGKFDARERVILTDFKGQSEDSTLRLTVTEAFRADLAQSNALTVMPANAVRETLRRMQRPITTPVDYSVAREIATREGIKAVIEGEVLSLGGRYVLSARLVAAQTGDELASLSETADDANDIIPAISRLSKKLRSRTGESLRNIQNARTLEKVTTPSLDALEKYMSAIRTMEVDGDFARGRELLEQAIAIDTGFAMAYRKLAVELNNRGLDPQRVSQAIQAAYDHRDRLSESERYLTEAAYYSYGPHPDASKASSAYESLLQRDPENTTALNNLAIGYMNRRQFARAETLLVRGVGLQNAAAVYHVNLLEAQLEQGKLADAEATVTRAVTSLPRNPGIAMFVRGQYELARGQFDDVARLTDSIRTDRSGDLSTQRDADYELATLSAVRGKLQDAVRWRRTARDVALQIGAPQAKLRTTLDEAVVDMWYRGRKEEAVRSVDTALRQGALDSLRADQRPYEGLAWFYARAGLVARARTMLAGYDSTRSSQDPEQFAAVQHRVQGDIALAEGKWDDAARELRAGQTGECTTCVLPDLARAYDLAGNADSAIAVFSQYASAGYRDLSTDAVNLAGSHKRLGELYDAKGDRQNAMSHYATFIELWKNADPELQPLVKQARDRLSTLQRAERK